MSLRHPIAAPICKMIIHMSRDSIVSDMTHPRYHTALEAKLAEHQEVSRDATKRVSDALGMVKRREGLVHRTRYDAQYKKHVLSLSLSHSLSHTHMHTLSHAHTSEEEKDLYTALVTIPSTRNMFSLSHTYTHIHTHTHTQSHSLTRTPIERREGLVHLYTALVTMPSTRNMLSLSLYLTHTHTYAHSLTRTHIERREGLVQCTRHDTQY